MTVVSFCNRKGGVGKSTLASTLAVFLVDSGYHVAALDTDPQFSMAQHLKEAEPEISLSVEQDPNKIPGTVKSLAERHDFVVVDSAAGLDEGTRALMLVTDIAILPMNPTIRDARSTKQATETLKYARDICGKPEQAWVVLNRVRKRTKLAAEFSRLAPSLGLQVARTQVRELVAYQQADIQGTSVLRMEAKFNPSVRAAQSDIRSLFEEIVPTKKRRAANE